MIKKLAPLAALIAASLLAFDACSGSGGHTVPFTPSTGKSVADGHVGLKILIPKKTKAASRRDPRYVSSATTQLTIDVQTGCPGNCSSQPGYPLTASLTPTSTGCSSTLAGTSCQLILALQPNTYTVTLTAKDAQGTALSTAQSIAFVVASGMNNTLSVTLSGIPSAIIASSLGFGAFLVEALDVDNNVIVGAGSPTYTVAQTSGSITLQQPTTTSPNIFYVSPTAAGAASISITASYGNGLTDGCSQPGAKCSASFTLASTQETDMFVSGGSSNTVVRLAPPYTGAPITTTSKGLDDAGGIAFNASGNLFVPNYASGSVTEYAFPYTGGPVATIRTGLSSPTSVAFDSKNDLFVADAGNSNIQEFAPPYTGASIYTLSNIDSAYGLTINSANYIFAASYTDGYVAEFPPPPSGDALYLYGFTNPQGIAVDANGEVYVANYGGNNVLEWQSSSDFSSFPSPATQLIGGLSSPASIALDPSNNLYVGQYGLRNIVSYAPPYTGSQIPGPMIGNPQGIVFRTEYTTTIQPSP